MEIYGLDGLNVQTFIRGTLRLDGWLDAWQSIFQAVEQSERKQTDTDLRDLSKELWSRYAYEQDEPDRVFLYVRLQAKSAGAPYWDKAYLLDSVGNKDASAMARLVSIPVSLAVEAVFKGQLKNGVNLAPSDPEIINSWLDLLKAEGEEISVLENATEPAST